MGVKNQMFWIPNSSASNVLRCQSRLGWLFYYQLLGFHQVIWGELQIPFYILHLILLVYNKFFWLNSVVINTFKVIKIFHTIYLDWIQKLKHPMIVLVVSPYSVLVVSPYSVLVASSVHLTLQLHFQNILHNSP